MRNLFVVIEGLDGTGKSTVTDEVALHLNQIGRPSIAMHTPDGDYRKITDYISNSCSVDAQYLFFLSAVKHASDLVTSHLHKRNVICDRYIYSTLAYHRARGTKVIVNLESLKLREPDYRFYLTVSDDEVRKARIRERGVVKPGDQLPFRRGGLLESIDAEFRKYGFQVIDTTNLQRETVASKIIEALR